MTTGKKPKNDIGENKTAGGLFLRQFFVWTEKDLHPDQLIRKEGNQPPLNKS